jgi:peptide deformylase
MVRPVLRLGAPALRDTAVDVDEIGADVRSLVDDMVATMSAARGIGLAAPQVGVALRIFVLDLSLGRDASALHVCINPTWDLREGMQMEEEGCLSLPGFEATVVRPGHAAVQALDIDGRSRRVEGTGLLARALQHEMDHLDGRLFVDRLRGISRAMILRKIHKLERAGRW